MATYILFWNPEISSYTMDRFYDDFNDHYCVGNWSFFEHEKVKYGDRYYMVRCGNGKTGIVMYGYITSKCYESEDWSPKNRKHIFYADLEFNVMINPETATNMLTPEILTELMPDFNWYGGHSGRLLSKNYAKKLDEIWANYINNNPQLFYNGEAIIDGYNELGLSKDMEKLLHKSIPCECEICGYDYKNFFSKEMIKNIRFKNFLRPVASPKLNRLFYSLCNNCRYLKEDDLIEILSKK